MALELPNPLRKLTAAVLATSAKKPLLTSSGAINKSGVGDGVNVGIDVGVGMSGVLVGTGVGGAVSRIMVGGTIWAVFSASVGVMIWAKIANPTKTPSPVNKMPASSQVSGEFPQFAVSVDSESNENYPIQCRGFCHLASVPSYEFAEKVGLREDF